MSKVIVFRNTLARPSETFIREQARALTDWEPVLVGYRRESGGLDLSGLNVRILPDMSSGRVHRLRLKLQQLSGKPHAHTVDALTEIGADLVHAHFGTDATDIWPSVRATKLPMLVTLHGYDINIHREWWESGKGGIRRRAYPRRLLQMAQDPAVHFIAVSKAIKARATEYGIPEEKLTVAYIGVDTKRFSPGGLPIEQRGNHILFVGRMVEEKAPLFLIYAYAEVRKLVPDAQLTMVGDGPLLPRAKDLAAKLCLPVKFLGMLGPNEVLAQFHEAAALCLPSIATPRGDIEAFGLVLLEAQACGVPVVTAALGGAVEAILDGKTGYSFKPGDLTQLAERIISILADPLRRRAMARNAAAFARDAFGIKSMTALLERTYSQTRDRVS